MNRLTKVNPDGTNYNVDISKISSNPKGYTGEAINKLAKFENIYEDLLKKQEDISKEMEKLRAEGKNNSVKFKQLLTNKISNNNIIAIFQVYGCDK